MNQIVQSLKSKGYRASHLDCVVNDAAKAFASGTNKAGIQKQKAFLRNNDLLIPSDIESIRYFDDIVVDGVSSLAFEANGAGLKQQVSFLTETCDLSENQILVMLKRK